MFTIDYSRDASDGAWVRAHTESLVQLGVLVPVEPCESFSPQSVHHCHYPKGHDGAHEAYRAYGYGVFHTVSWAHTFSAGAGIGGERYQSTPENDTPGIGGDDVAR